MDDNSGYDESFVNQFSYNARFISNFLSSKIRRLKFVTDGKFNMIAVTPSLSINKHSGIVGDSALQARVRFDKSSYIRMSEFECYDYYLSLLEMGYKTCSNHHKVPIDELLTLHKEFRGNGYKNEWIHKRKKFTLYGIQVILKCEFTAFDFKLIISVANIKTHEELVSGIVIRTLPDEVFFSSLFKDIMIGQDHLIITDSQNRPKFKFSLKDLRSKKLSIKVSSSGLKYVKYRGKPNLLFPRLKTK